MKTCLVKRVDILDVTSLKKCAAMPRRTSPSGCDYCGRDDPAHLGHPTGVRAGRIQNQSLETTSVLTAKMVCVRKMVHKRMDTMLMQTWVTSEEIPVFGRRKDLGSHSCVQHGNSVLFMEQIFGGDDPGYRTQIAFQIVRMIDNFSFFYKAPPTAGKLEALERGTDGCVRRCWFTYWRI